MYRASNDSRSPFSRPAGTGRAALGSLAAAAVVIGIIVACEHGRVSQPAANGSVAEPATDAATPTATPVVASAPTAPTVPADVSFGTAESAYASHDFPTAMAMFTAYTTRRPHSAQGYYMLGLSAWRAGKLEDAQHALETSLTLDPQRARTLVNLARVLLEQQRPTDALDRATQAVALDSGLGEGWRVLGRAQAQLGHTDDAINAYQAALKIDSTDVWALNDLGLVLIDAGRYADAVTPLTRAVQIDSTVPTFNNNLGIALERSGQPSAAAVAYRGALAADSGYDKARVSLERIGKLLGTN